MSYLTVLPLEDMKIYLRIDDTQNETDAEITSMIKSALRWIENKTNIIVYARDIDYTVVNGDVRVYDHPINSVISPTEDVNEYKYRSYKQYCLSNDVDTLTLNVGYELPEDVPEDILEVAKVAVSMMFYNQESDEAFNEALPQWCKDVINTNRRFIL